MMAILLLLGCLALLLYDEMIEIISEEKLFNNFENPIVIPLPLSSKRRQERGWNQSELIGQELAKLSSEWQYDPNILLKIRHTLPQTKLRREERLKNLKGCFLVSKNSVSKISGRNIILIDDVTTTGSTIIEARRTLLAAGARQVLAFTVAH
jgi:ComF family protein